VHSTTTARPGILTMRQARSALPDLVKRAELHREEIRLGGRGEDRVTLIASDALRELKVLAQIGQQALAGHLPVASDPWAGIKRAVAEGRLSADGTFARAYQLQVVERETRSWAEMSASGMADTTEPEFRRRFVEEPPVPPADGPAPATQVSVTRMRG
jgi:hypothetical protein